MSTTTCHLRPNLLNQSVIVKRVLLHTSMVTDKECLVGVWMGVNFRFYFVIKNDHLTWAIRNLNLNICVNAIYTELNVNEYLALIRLQLFNFFLIPNMLNLPDHMSRAVT